jgi:mono/diheme cytochrome c family protein
MKRILKIVAIILGIVFFAVVVLLAYIQFAPMPVYENEAPEYTFEFDSLDVEAGAKIAAMTCANCHRSKDSKLGGAYMRDNDSFGEIYATNITSHKSKGIANYTAGELKYLLRTGIKKDGSYAPPWMPKYPNMSDLDMKRVIAFLKSDHPMVQPSENQVPATKYNMLSKALIKFKVFGPLHFDDKPVSHPYSNDKVALGKYLATAVYDCYGCHSPDFKTQNILFPEKTPGYFSGGNPFVGNEGQLILTRNLTMDKKTGIGTWTKEQFIENVKFGTHPHGGAPNRYPMLAFSTFSDAEAGAIYAYLKTIPVIENEIEKNIASE